jgi:hypothetical protein
MTFTVTVERAFLKRIYAQRIFGDSWKIGIAFLALTIGVVTLYSSPSTRAWAMLFAGVVVLGAGVLVSAWLIQIKQIDKWADRQGSAPVTYTIGDGSIEATSESGANKLRFAVFEKLEIQKEAVLLYYSRMGALTLPLAQVPQEALDLLVAKLSLHNIPIRKEK